MFEAIKNLFSKKPFSIYITDTCIQVLDMDKSGGGFKIKSIGEISLPEGVVENGFVKSPNKLAEYIKVLLAGAKPVPIESKQCYLALPETQCFYHLEKLPAKLTGKELVKELEIKITERIPVPFLELKYDFAKHRISDDHQFISVVALRREVIAQYYETVKYQCGLKPVLFEPSSISLLRNIKDAHCKLVVVDNHNHYNWFIICHGLIFDSNILHELNVDNDLELLTKDIEASIKSIAENHDYDIKQIDVVGTPNLVELITGKLAEDINIPIKHGDLHVNLNPGPAATGHRYNILSGLMLNSHGIETKMKVNLLS